MIYTLCIFNQYFFYIINIFSNYYFIIINISFNFNSFILLHLDYIDLISTFDDFTC